MLDRFLAGDKRAFDLLVEPYRDRVFRRCLRFFHDREEAFDATQQTFLNVLRGADGFQRRSAFSTWLYRITENTCKTLLRQKKRRPDRLPEWYDPTDKSATRDFEIVELLDLLDALDKLPRKFGEPVRLRGLCGLSYKEISERLEVSLGTVKSRIYRGRKMLNEQLGNPRDTPDHPKGHGDD